MTDNQIQEVLKRIDALAAKLGVGAETLWAALIKQAAVDFWSSLVFLILCAVSGYFYFTRYIPFVKRAADDDDGFAAPACAGAVIWGIFLFVVAISVALKLDLFIASLVNPEYWAFDRLLHLLRK